MVVVAVGPGGTTVTVACVVEVGARATVGEGVADGEATGDGPDGVGLAAGPGGACLAKQPIAPVTVINSAVVSRMAGPELSRISSHYLQPALSRPGLPPSH